MPKKAAVKAAAKCCDAKKTGKMPFIPFKKGEKPNFKKGGK